MTNQSYIWVRKDTGLLGMEVFDLVMGQRPHLAVIGKKYQELDYGGLHLFDENIYLRGGNEYNHGLKYASSNFGNGSERWIRCHKSLRFAASKK